MSFVCDKCNKTFLKNQNLQLHLRRKTPCVVTKNEGDKDISCKDCGRTFSRLDNLRRHHKNYCKLSAKNDVNDLVAGLQSRVDALEKSGAAHAAQNIIGNQVMVNNFDSSTKVVIEKIEIRPWGSPLELTAADIATSLSTIPALAGNLAINQIVDVLIELTKRAHMSPESRNIHLNPKRSDQALALVENGWAAVPLKDATRILFDGAAGCIANQLKPANIAATLPQQYRNDRENCVSLGMKPMVAHLTNVAPGGPGPCLQIENVAQAGAAVQQQPIQQQPVQVDIHTAAALVRPLKSANEITAAWLEQQAKNTNLTVPAIVNAIWRAGSAGLCGVLESRTAQEILRDNPYLRML